jgi:predicted nucleic acid-binding protein
VIELWDTSALILAARDPVLRVEWQEALRADEVALTDAIVLEFLNGARNLDEYDRVRDQLDAVRRLPMIPEDWARALTVHRRLATLGPGHQRSVRLVDLAIAAVAERNALVVVHVDTDYDRISGITGQAVRWLGPRPTHQAG